MRWTRHAVAIAAIALAAGAAAGKPGSGGRSASPAGAAEERGGLRLLAYAPPGARDHTLYLRATWSDGQGWKKPDRGAAPWKVSSWQLFTMPARNTLPLYAGTPSQWEEDELCPTFAAHRRLTGGVAISGGAIPRPRRARRLPTGTAGLQADTRDLLSRHGIRTDLPIRVVEAWAVDLDGNGTEETLWTARSRAGWTSPYRDPAVPGHARWGDYALLALRYLDGGKVRLWALAVASADSAAPNYRVFCPLNVDGDGRMEILAHAQYFEEDELLIFAFDGRKARGLAGTPFPSE